VVAKTIKKFKKIDVLFNNAGLWIEGDLEKNSSERISQVLAVNTLGTILLTRLVLPMMKKRKRGLIVNLISQAGLYAKPQRSVYNASKWAITGFTKSLQQELETAGVRVTGVYPGKVETNLFKNAGLNKNMKNALPVDTVARLVTMVVNFSEVATLPEVGVKF
jgi:short-subunit dehydrogenase